MADTDTETLPNGNATLSAEEEERLKQRPADIDADVREMERRKRVEAIMSSKLFREELERVLDQQMHEGNDAPLLQRIREMVGGRLHTGSLRGPSCMLPINDIRGIEGVGYEKGEKILRCKLAAVYRLVDLFGWTQTGIAGQITARLNTAVEQVLTTPRGLLPHEVTASSLVKLDMQGVVQDQGTTNFPVNVEGFSLHASVHAARPDVRCVLHVRSAPALAVSATRRGLLPLCGEAALLGDVAYHRVPGGTLDNEERDKLVRALGPHAKVLVLAGGGALCCGATLEEAFYQARNLHAACEVQLRLAALPQDDLLLLDDDTRRQLYESSRKPPGDATKWRVGGEEFEALMRMMDNAGFRTGHVYRHPLIKNDVPKPRSDVEVPPAVSSLGYLLEEEELYKQGLWKKGGKSGERTRWLNSPNVYQKVELLETGTSDPKRITKWVDANNEEWVQEGSPAHSTPVKIDTLQFVPKNTNPKEFKQLQQQIKDNRRADKISAGPQSHILEGVARDEARLLPEDAAGTHTGDHVILMGAASKGIIQRGYQHNATMYSAPYARNPFDHVTDTDIDEYRRVVERKQRGHDYDTDISESEALSAPPRSAPDTEDESRDEQRVLRIETKQVPVMSQPEVVLSDADPTDFLNAERDHADRTRGTRDANTNEALSSHKRSLHKYTRNSNFDSTIQKYNTIPKCKTSLNSQLGSARDYSLVFGNSSSRCSLFSIPSIDLDRCKFDYSSRSRLLNMHKRDGNIYRTRSHSSFINSYIKDPEPMHYHLPKCNSCGTIISSYSKENIKYLSAENIPMKSSNLEVDLKPTIVKVKEDTVSIYKVESQEFVDSQEFNEDNYLGDIGHSFSSNNQTVVEKIIETKEGNVHTDENYIKVDNPDETYRATYVEIDDDIDSTEGEYHSFTDEMEFVEAVYESPVKNLVEKDIRDYSVPIDFFCDDYNKKDRKRSPQKTLDIPKQTILEPILEESKSSSDDSCNSNKIMQKEIQKVAKSDCFEELPIERNTNAFNLDNKNSQFHDNKKEDSYIELPKEYENNIYSKDIFDDIGKKDIRFSSFSVGSSGTAQSFDSTVEFEKYELIADVISIILNKFENILQNKHIDGEESLEAEQKSQLEVKSKEVSVESFSITEMVNDYELNQPSHNDVLNETSESEANYSHKTVEAIIYYIFDAAVYYCDKKEKRNRKRNSKKVITVVDCEDIIYTAWDKWLFLNDSSNYTIGENEMTDEKDNKIEDDVDINIVGMNMFEEMDTKDDDRDDTRDDVNIAYINLFKDVDTKDSKFEDNINIAQINFKSADTNDTNKEYDKNSNNINDLTINGDIEIDGVGKGNDANASITEEGSFTYYDNYENESKDSTEIASELLNSVLDKSFKTCDSDATKSLDETFVLDKEVMNMAFVDSDVFYNRSSSPLRSVFDVCTESPIKRKSLNSSLYEKDSMDSPFLKRTNVLSMSQTVHSGGIKYWLSFDDNLVLDKPKPKPIHKYTDNLLPSFLVVDFDDKKDLNHDSTKSIDESIDINTSKYNTCDTSKLESSCREKLLYDSREIKAPRTLHSTWPPYDDAIFYKILSKFRLTESFDFTELEKRCGSF